MKKRKTIMLLITYSCNLRCTYCYEPKMAHHSMSANDAMRYIQQQVALLKSSYYELEVQFMGGEPLMAFSLIKEVSEWLWKENFNIPLVQIFVPTNGTLLNDEMKAWFSQHKEQICLGLSFDGNRLMQNINRSQSSSLVDLKFFAQTWPNQSVKMTISPETLPLLYDGVMFFYEQNIFNVAVDLAMGKNVEWKHKHLALLAEQLQRLSSYYITNPSTPRISMLDLDIAQVLNRESNKKCSCGEDLVCIDFDGTAYACHVFAPITAPKNLANSSREIDFANSKSKVSYPCDKCLLFPLCTFCYGMNYLQTGDITKQSAFTCQAFKIQFLATCDLQQQIASQTKDVHKTEIINKIVSLFPK